MPYCINVHKRWMRAALLIATHDKALMANSLELSALKGPDRMFKAVQLDGIAD